MPIHRKRRIIDDFLQPSSGQKHKNRNFRNFFHPPRFRPSRNTLTIHPPLYECKPFSVRPRKFPAPSRPPSPLPAHPGKPLAEPAGLDKGFFQCAGPPAHQAARPPRERSAAISRSPAERPASVLSHITCHLSRCCHQEREGAFRHRFHGLTRSQSSIANHKWNR